MLKFLATMLIFLLLSSLFLVAYVYFRTIANPFKKLVDFARGLFGK